MIEALTAKQLRKRKFLTDYVLVYLQSERSPLLNTELVKRAVEAFELIEQETLK